jgi:hypothetical protein
VQTYSFIPTASNGVLRRIKKTPTEDRALKRGTISERKKELIDTKETIEIIIGSNGGLKPASGQFEEKSANPC